MSEGRREYMRQYHRERRAKAPPAMCQRCGNQPKAPGSGQRYCLECKAGEWRCPQCGAVMARRESVRENGATYTSHFCRTCSNARILSRYHDDRERWQTLRAVRTYGLTEEQYEEMLAACDGKCEVCGDPPAKTSRATNRLHVDHCHTTGEVRGLLCHRCNMALGMARDRVEILASLARYLTRAPSTRVTRKPALIPTMKDEEWRTLIPTSPISTRLIELSQPSVQAAS